MNAQPHKKLKHFFSQDADLELAFLIGSRANNSFHANSDWDFALRWHKHLSAFEKLAETERVRYALGKLLDCADHKVDIVDIASAGLAMRATVANEGIILKGDGVLALNHFLNRTWRELETFYWADIYGT